MYGEAIIDRLHPRCSLRDENNPVRKVLINTLGAILDEFDIQGSLDAPYLQEARGVYLDLHGKDLNVPRRSGEADDDYRRRLYYEVLGYLTVAYLLNVYELDLFVFVQDFSLTGLTLTSDNPYICGGGFMSIADEETQRILENKFILGSGLTWLQTP